MPSRHCRSFIRVFVFIVFILICGLTGSIALGQGAKQKLADTSIPDADADHVQQRSEWFFRGRLVPPQTLCRTPPPRLSGQAPNVPRAPRPSPCALTEPPRHPPVGGHPSAPRRSLPMPPETAPRTTTRLPDAPPPSPSIPPTRPAIPSISAARKAESRKSTNAANNTANRVLGTPVTDDQATLSIGALAIQPRNSDPDSK